MCGFRPCGMLSFEEPNPMPPRRYSRPRTAREYLILARTLAVPLAALACIAALLLANHRFQRDKQHWPSATAVIESVRIQPIAGRPFEYGSTQLYELDVLVINPLTSPPQHGWLPLSQAPRPLTEVRAQAATLKGQRCTLRQDSAHPDETIAELR